MLIPCRAPCCVTSDCRRSLSPRLPAAMRYQLWQTMWPSGWEIRYRCWHAWWTKMYKPQRVHPLGILFFTVRSVYPWTSAFHCSFWPSPNGNRKWIIVAFLFCLYFSSSLIVLYWMRFEFYISGQELRVVWVGSNGSEKKDIPLRTNPNGNNLPPVFCQRCSGLVQFQW